MADSRPTWRNSSTVRGVKPRARGWISRSGWRSTRTDRTPWWARNSAVDRPLTPPPTTRTGVRCTDMASSSVDGMSTRASIIQMDDIVNHLFYRIILLDEIPVDPGYDSAVSKASAETTPGGARRRRAPAPGERRRDPERTRAKILDAAATEFSDKGYAGARVSGI